MTRASTMLLGLALALPLLAAPRTAAAQDECTRIDPPPPPECFPQESFGVSVTPDGGTEPTRPANTGGHSAWFEVTNTGTAWGTFSVSCFGSANLTCTGVSPSSFNLGPGGSASVFATYSVGSPGTGSLHVSAWIGEASDGGSYSVPIVAYGVNVTPDGGAAPTRTANTGGHSESFTVQNTGSASNTFSFSCSGAGGVTCGAVPAAVTIAPGAQTTVSQGYSVGAPGTGTLTVTASGTNASNPGSYSIPIVSYGVSLTPDGATAAARPANTGGYSESFTVQNTGSASNTFSFSCSGAGGVTCGAVPAAVTLGAGAQTIVSMPYSVGAPGTGTLTLTASGTNASNPGSYSVPIATFGASVTPDGGTAPTRTANTGGYSESFTVQNTGSTSNTFSFSCNGAGGVTCGTVPGAVSLGAGAQTTVSMPYSVGAAGTGTLTLTANGSNASNPGSYSVPIVSYGVSVTPDGGTAPTRIANTGGHSETFTVTNTGSASNTYSFACSGAGGVTCGAVPAAVTLGAGLQTTVSMPFSVGAPGTGTLTLTASGTNASNPGSYSVPIASYGVAVTPDGGTAPARAPQSSGHSETFTVRNTGSASNTFGFACGAAGPVTCGTAPAAVTLGAGAQTTVGMQYSVGGAGTGTLTLTATGTNASDAGSYSVPVQLSGVTGGLFTKDNRYLLIETADTYDPAGRISQLTDARGKVTTYQYGGNVNNAFLTKVTRVHDASGPIDLVTDIAYDTDGFVQSLKDEGGTFRYFTYDLYGRLRQIKNHSGTVVEAHGYTYSRTSPNWTFNPASPNAIVDTTFIQQTPSVKAVVSTSFIDGLGQAIQTVLQDGTNYHVTATQYDLLGRQWRSWKPYTRTTAGYDASFATNATSFHNTYHATANAKPYVETSYTADALARIKQVTPEYIGTTPTAFVLHGYGVDVATKQQFAEVTDEVGKKTRTYTDVFGNQVRNIMGFGAPEATTTLFAYNVLGQRTQVTDPRNLVSTFAVDTRGLLTTRTSPEAGSLNSKYDRAGNVRYTQDANQPAVGQVLFTTYDFAARPLTSGVGAATFATLDPDAPSPPALETTQANWLIVRQYDAKPSTAVFPWSRFTSQITPLTLSNVNGRLAAIAGKSNGAWQVTLFSYDADGELATRYTYTEANGGASVLTALNTSISYVRDLRGSLTQRWLTVGTSTFNHWYDYDGRGLLAQVFSSTSSTKPAVADVTDTFRPGGQPQNYQFQGGSLVPIRYTIREQTEKIGDPALTTYPFSARYTYNTNATLFEAEFYSAGSPAAQKRYRYQFPTYDALNRLKSADFSSWSGSAWTVTAAYDLAGINYDAAGNLTALQRYRDAGTLIDNLTYGNATTSNRLNSVNDAVAPTSETWDAETGAFTYDANGNIATAPGPYSLTAVTYNHQNLPLSVTRSGITTAYRYDDVGQRISKQTGAGNTELYVLEGASNLGVFTVDGAGTPVSWYFNVLAGSRVVGRHTNAGTRTYYHADLLGSTRAVVSTTGAVVESYDFEPWGLLMAGRTLAGPTKEGFGAKEQDVETGLDYFGARYYMPALGRWGNVDPAASSTPEWSPYVFVNNNPATQTDPDGRQAEIAIAVMRAHPEFTQGVAEGFVEGAKSTWHMITHPIQTAKGLLTVAAAGMGNPEAQLQVAMGVSAAADGLVSEWNSGERGKGRVVGRVLEGVAEAAVTWGAGEAVAAIKGARAAGVVDDVAGASRLGGDAAEAGGRVGRRIPNDELTPPTERGLAPTGSDGHPVELHHPGQTHANSLDEMTRTEHRGQGNFKRNHPNTSQQRSKIDRQRADRERRQHWCTEWDDGRWEQKKC